MPARTGALRAAISPSYDEDGCIFTAGVFLCRARLRKRQKVFRNANAHATKLCSVNIG